MKQSIKAEKEKVEEDLGHLQRRNQQLLEEVEQLRTNINYQFKEGASARASAPLAPLSRAPQAVRIFKLKTNLKKN